MSDAPKNEKSKRRGRVVKQAATPDVTAVSKGDHPTENEMRFVREYVIEHNATRAYLKVFPSATYGTAGVEACNLLKKPRIKREVAALESLLLRQSHITAKKVLRELAGIAFFDIGDLYEHDNSGMPKPRNFGQLPPQVRKVIQSVKIKRRNVPSLGGEQSTVEEVDIRLHSKIDALDKLCKHLGLTNDGDSIRKLLDALGQSPANDPEVPASGPSEGSGDKANRVDAS